MDTFNKFMVGVQGDYITVMMPSSKMTKADALTFAAWIVALADYDDKFPEVLAAVQS